MATRPVHVAVYTQTYNMHVNGRTIQAGTQLFARAACSMADMALALNTLISLCL